MKKPYAYRKNVKLHNDYDSDSLRVVIAWERCIVKNFH